MKMTNKWKKISMIVVGMMGLATLSFNCSPSLFESAKGRGGSSDFSSTMFDKPNAPISLLTAEQTYQSMLNVTGQAAAPVSGTEYNLRFSTMASTDSLANFSSPLLLASTSLAGDVCNNLMNTEKGAATRNYFAGVNFNAGFDASSPAVYSAVVEGLAKKFWGRDLNSDEVAIFTSFYTEFSAGATNNGDLTNDLYLGVCSAMLASFDSLVY